MPFGKYQDLELAEIPQHYLRWVKSQKWVGGWLVKEIDNVLNGKTVAETDESFEEALKALPKEFQNG